MVNTTHLRALCEVVRGGSFAAAGRQLGFTSSAVSQQIAALERMVGVTLFEREPRGIRATPAALYVAAQGEELLMRLDDLGAANRPGRRGARNATTGQLPHRQLQDRAAGAC